MTRTSRRELFPHAILGNGALLVTLSRRGEVEQAWWPHVDHDPHLGTLRLGAVDGLGLRWLDAAPAGAYTQAYEPDASILTTTLDATCAVTDHVTPDAPVLVRHVTGLDARLAVHVRPELAGQTQGGGAYLDPVSGALVLHRRDRVLAVALDVPATGTLGERQHGDDVPGDIADDGLRGSGVVHGEIEGALVADAVHAEVTVAIAFAATHAEAIRLAADAARGDRADGLAARRSADTAALATTPVLVTDEAGAIERRSQLVFGQVADRATGGVVAAPEQDPWFARSGGYGYVWARDLAFILLAHLASGRADLAGPALDWLVHAQGEDGLWLQRNWTDGTLAPSWGTQLDETGAVLFAYGQALATLDDPGLHERLWPSLSRGAEALVAVLDPHTGLPAPSMDLWEERVGLHAYTAAATHAGLVTAARVAAETGDDDRAARWRDAADRVLDGIQTHLWSEQHGRYLRSIQLARKDGLGEPVPDAYGLLPTHAQHPVGSVDAVDPTPDAALLGLAWPFAVLPPDDPRMAATIEAVAIDCRAPDGGLLRYPGDRYRGGNPWVLTTLWLGLTRRAAGEAVPADGIDYAVRAATTTQLLPEQVDAATGAPAWIVPLTWSHAMFVLACRPEAPSLLAHRQLAAAPVG